MHEYVEKGNMKLKYHQKQKIEDAFYGNQSEHLFISDQLNNLEDWSKTPLIKHTLGLSEPKDQSLKIKFNIQKRFGNKNIEHQQIDF